MYIYTYLPHFTSNSLCIINISFFQLHVFFVCVCDIPLRSNCAARMYHCEAISFPEHYQRPAPQLGMGPEQHLLNLCWNFG